MRIYRRLCAGIADDPKGALFRTISRGPGKRHLSETPLPQANAYAMVQRRARQAGIATRISNHTFRATGITAYLKNDGKLWNLREWLDGLKYLFVKPGILRRIFFAYFSFYKKDFHPWQHDNRKLITEWEQGWGRSFSRN